MKHCAREGGVLQTQAFQGYRPRARAFNAPVRHKEGLGIKPKGGLWTSTWDPVRETSGWLEWCRIERQESWIPSKDMWWLLEPHPCARVYTIDTYEDLERLMERYGYNHFAWAFGRDDDPDFRFGRGLDFPRIRLEYDAIHLTAAGEWRTRLSMPYNLYGWDCETTLWLRWMFVDVRRAFPKFSPHERYHGKTMTLEDKREIREAQKS